MLLGWATCGLKIFDSMALTMKNGAERRPAKGGAGMDWNAIKTEYITTGTSYRKLAKKYGVSYVQIGHVGKEENWVELRKQHLDKVFTKTLANDAKKKVDRAKRLRDATDRLLTKVERAIDELDLQLVTNKTKTKTIEYKNTERPDKPTREVIDEQETILSVSSIVDRKGLQQIAAALRDIREIHGIQTELDKQEQKARIANLQRQAPAHDDEDEGTGVVLLPPVLGEDSEE